MITVNLVLERETKGALRYQEVNDQGQPVDQAVGALNTMYVRKSAFNGQGFPHSITVTVIATEELR